MLLTGTTGFVRSSKTLWSGFHSCVRGAFGIGLDTVCAA
jgi:hypothetical protein